MVDWAGVEPASPSQVSGLCYSTSLVCFDIGPKKENKQNFHRSLTVVQYMVSVKTTHRFLHLQARYNLRRKRDIVQSPPVLAEALVTQPTLTQKR